jgi:hypothetical protein
VSKKLTIVRAGVAKKRFPIRSVAVMQQANPAAVLRQLDVHRRRQRLSLAKTITKSLV